MNAFSRSSETKGQKNRFSTPEESFSTSNPIEFLLLLETQIKHTYTTIRWSLKY